MQLAAKQEKILELIEDGMTVEELRKTSPYAQHITIQVLNDLSMRRLVQIKGGMDDEGNTEKVISLK